MDTEGQIRPESPAAARATYRELVPAAKVATREATKAMAFDRAEYADRVTPTVIESVRDAIFASLLVVHVADRETFDDWTGDRAADVTLTGSDHAPNVVWHDPPFTDRVVAATFTEKREAAVGTLRRQAFGRIYRDLLGETDEDTPERAGMNDAASTDEDVDDTTATDEQTDVDDTTATDEQTDVDDTTATNELPDDERTG